LGALGCVARLCRGGHVVQGGSGAGVWSWQHRVRVPLRVIVIPPQQGRPAWSVMLPMSPIPSAMTVVSSSTITSTPPMSAVA
jgi:hypothetical protein